MSFKLTVSVIQMMLSISLGWSKNISPRTPFLLLCLTIMNKFELGAPRSDELSSLRFCNGESFC